MSGRFQCWRDRATERVVILREVQRRFEVVDVDDRVLHRFSDEDVAEDWLIREGYEDVTGSTNHADDEHAFPDIGGFKASSDTR